MTEDQLQKELENIKEVYRKLEIPLPLDEELKERILRGEELYPGQKEGEVPPASQPEETAGLGDWFRQFGKSLVGGQTRRSGLIDETGKVIEPTPPPPAPSPMPSPSGAPTETSMLTPMPPPGPSPIEPPLPQPSQPPAGPGLPPEEEERLKRQALERLAAPRLA